MLTPNKLRQKLSTGKVLHGCEIFSWGLNVVDIAAAAGLDFIRLDNQHAWRQDQSTELLIRAAVAADIPTMLRVDKDNPFLIRKALEIGANAVLVPQINYAQEAKAVVSAAKFPPLGHRDFNSCCFSGGWKTHNPAEWIEWSNKEPMVGVTIESPIAMNEIEEIINVDGLDFFLFGPGDFSLGLGLNMPDANHPEVQAALIRIIAAAKKAGKYVSMPIGGINLEATKKYSEMGVSMIEHGSDLTALYSAWKNIPKND